MNSLSVAILAGGLATRLRPITETIPKGLVPILGRPFLAHQIELLKKHGIHHLVLCVGHLGEMIETELGDGSDWGVEIEYSYDGPVLLGTAGALRQALPMLGPEFFVLYGDSYLEIDYQAVAAVYRASIKKGLMTVYDNQGKWDTSNVEFIEGELRNYSKKERTPRMHHIDYGLSILRAEVLQRLTTNEPSDLADVYSDMVAMREMIGYEVFTRFFEVGSKNGISELEQHLKNNELR